MRGSSWQAGSEAASLLPVAKNCKQCRSPQRCVAVCARLKEVQQYEQLLINPQEVHACLVTGT